MIRYDTIEEFNVTMMMTDHAPVNDYIAEN